MLRFLCRAISHRHVLRAPLQNSLCCLGMNVCYSARGDEGRSTTESLPGITRKDLLHSVEN